MRLARLPGVRGTGAVSAIPSLAGFGRTPFAVDGMDPLRDDQLPVASWKIVSRDYLETLGVPLIRGRLFSTVTIRMHPLSRHQRSDRPPVSSAAPMRWGSASVSTVIQTNRCSM